jgi:hypothetical protein
MIPRKGKEKKEQVISLELQVAKGENDLVFTTSLHPSMTPLSTSLKPSAT